MNRLVSTPFEFQGKPVSVVGCPFFRVTRRASCTRAVSFLLLALLLGQANSKFVHAQGEEANIALRSDYPRIETDCRWLGGSTPMDLLDGLTSYSDWARGLACSRGVSGNIAVDLGKSQTFHKVVLWHHGGNDRIPLNITLEYWSGHEWVAIDVTREVEVGDSFPQTDGYGSFPDYLTFAPVTGSKVRYSYVGGPGLDGGAFDHSWLYQFDVFATGERGEEVNIALRSDYPRIESDCSWLAGSNPMDLLDGLTSYSDWARGLACARGGSGQIAVDFGKPQTFHKVVLWHHGGNDRIPLNIMLDYWSGDEWVAIDVTREVEVGDSFPQTDGYGSFPDYLTFAPVTGSKVRYSYVGGPGLDGGAFDHSWLYQFDVFANGGALFLRGDCNDDGAVDISDALCTLEWLFLGSEQPGCLAASNGNGDETVDISDPIFLLEFLFLGAPPPVGPFPDCGTSDLETDQQLGCETSPKSCQNEVAAP